MKNRVDITEFIVGAERKFPVNSWKINDIHLWPLLRIRIFFYLINIIEAQKGVTSENMSHARLPFPGNIIGSVKSKIKNIGDVVRCFRWLNGLPSRKYLFVGFDGHRVNHKGKRYNKFFDALIEKHNLRKDSAFFECGPEPAGIQYHSDIILKYHGALTGFLAYHKMFVKDKPVFTWEGYADFLDYLSENELTRSFAAAISKGKAERWCEDFPVKVLFFEKVLQRLRPESVHILCYYSFNEVMALTAAANRLGIKTIEMQHGPQTEIHLCYGSWSVVPDSGYDILPRGYWCWDDYSKRVLDQWVSRNALYNVKVTGNPWIDHWKNSGNAYPHKDFILYSLQPAPVTVPQLFPDVLTDFIKNQPYQWFLRLHPRQLDEKENIKAFLEQKRILHLVNIDDATNDALPQLLANARLHVTHFSGSAIEAGMFGVFSVLLNEIAVTSFPDLIAEGNAKFIAAEDPEFETLLLEIVKTGRDGGQNVIFAEQPKDELF
jgi:hypothetical protein